MLPENESIEAPLPRVNKPLGYLRKLVRSDSKRKSPYSGGDPNLGPPRSSALLWQQEYQRIPAKMQPVGSAQTMPVPWTHSHANAVSQVAASCGCHPVTLIRFGTFMIPSHLSHWHY